MISMVQTELKRHAVNILKNPIIIGIVLGDSSFHYLSTAISGDPDEDDQLYSTDGDSDRIDRHRSWF